MVENQWPVLLSRLDFGWITTLHILYPPLTIGLAALLFFSEFRWVRSGNDHWYRLCRFFEKLLIINFAAGVATGITMEMAFGILYGPFSQAVGPFFGQVLGYETITAFMYEAGFIGLMIFGWGKVSKRMHLFATFNVALSSAFSAMWILVANSWMQTPTGVAIHDGVFTVKDWWSALFNPDVIYAFPHMLVACLELSLAVVISISAFYLLKRRNVSTFQKAFKYAMLVLVPIAALQIYLGDGMGLTVAEDQKPVLAAMEGHYNTYNPDGSVNTGWHVLAWPNADNTGNAWAITIPHVLSLLETHSWDGKVTGMNAFPVNDRPSVPIPFYGFRVMVAVGFAMFGLSLWGLYLWFRGRLAADTVTNHRWFLRAAVASAFLPYLSVWVGWWTREVGRQPWVVYGIMRTADGVSRMSNAQELLWLGCYVVFELAVWGSTWWFLNKIVRNGPDMTSPIPGDGDQNLGELEDAPRFKHDANPTPSPA